MPSVSTLIACNSPSLFPPKTLNPKITSLSSPQNNTNPRIHFNPSKLPPAFSPFRRNFLLHICQSSSDKQNSKDPVSKNGVSAEPKLISEGNGRDWTTSILLFGLWAGLMYYVFLLSPNQTPTRDVYFLEKLLNLRGDDGFRMNEVLVSLWYIMGLWPLVYSMLLLPSGRSSNSQIPVWPFLVLSCFGGAYVLLPYFVLWKPPPPQVEEAELTRWPLNFLESKLLAGTMLAAGLGIVTYAGLAGGDVWREFAQYFRESKFIHATCLDFSLLSAFSTFWVYNDMTTRKWYDKGSWLLPVALIPFLGPALYLVLRPPLSASSTPSTMAE